MKRGIFDNPYAHLPGEQPCKDLEHNDLMELYGYDEERGLSKIMLEQGTEIEIPIEDELGAITWVAGMISSIQMGSLDFQAEFLGSAIDAGTWRQTRSRAEMDVTWRLPPALRRRQPAVHIISLHKDTHYGTTLNTGHTGSDSNPAGLGLTRSITCTATHRIGYSDGEEDYLR